MNLRVDWISKGLCEVTVDAITTGMLDAGEAKELARELLTVADELLSVEEGV